MHEIHWSIWISLSMAVIGLAWFVRPARKKGRVQVVEELEITIGDALGIVVLLCAVGLAMWLGY